MCAFCEDPENWGSIHDKLPYCKNVQPVPENQKWHNRYLEMADLVAKWSKDPSSQIGAIIVGEHGQILSTGYNGFPRGIKDTPERLDNREVKYGLIVHAEMNAIYNAALTKVSIEGGTLYVSGLPPCAACALGVIQSGISHVVCRSRDINKSDKWKESWALTKMLFDEAGIEYTIIEGN
jgi:dCMP deaminase